MTVGTIEDSRLKGGTLVLDSLPFAKQATEVTLEPSVVEEGERIESLSGATLDPSERTDWVLNVGAVQDFNDPAGFVEFCRANAGEVVTFSWLPNADGAPTYSGSLRVRATTIGGAVNTRLATTPAFPVTVLDAPAYPGP
jgi:hypothetical protein